MNHAKILQKKTQHPKVPGRFFYVLGTNYLGYLIAACAAASLAIGTRYGEQDT